MRLRFFAAESAAQNDIEGRTLLNALQQLSSLTRVCTFSAVTASITGCLHYCKPAATHLHSPQISPREEPVACASPGVVRLEKYRGDDELSFYCLRSHIVSRVGNFPGRCQHHLAC